MGVVAMAQLAADRGRTLLHGTADADEVIGACTGALRPHALVLRRADAHLDTRLSHVRLGDVTVNLLRYGTGVTVRSGDAALNDYLLTLPLAGTARFHYGGAEAVATPRRGVIVGPHHDFEFEFGASWEQLIVRLDRGRVESVAAALSGQTGPVHFDLALAPDVGGLDGLLESALTLTGSTVVVQRPQLLWRLEQLIIETLLLAQPNNRTSTPDIVGATPSARLRRAMDFMLDRLAEPLTVTKAADAAGLSVRTLQAVFRRELDTSPVQWLRAQRLERAHALLTSGAPGLTVTDVAYRCGFFHLGEFGAAFRRRYGATPSAVLASRR